LWFQEPVQVSFSHGNAWLDILLIGVIGVIGVEGEVPITDRPLKLPQPKRDVLEEGEATSSRGGMGGLGPFSKQLTPTPAAYERDWFDARSCFHPIKPPSASWPVMSGRRMK
jgi:hypothetical protein